MLDVTADSIRGARPS